MIGLKGPASWRDKNANSVIESVPYQITSLDNHWLNQGTVEVIFAH
ncbi:hypothetical protein [Siminovitchia terrae]|nr:hypothetical protein [Siminovitchia terrae]